MSKCYYVRYKMYFADKEHGICQLASSKEDAYYKALYVSIPMKENGHHPYSAWVSSVTYNNGNYKMFNTFEGKPI